MVEGTRMSAIPDTFLSQAERPDAPKFLTKSLAVWIPSRLVNSSGGGRRLFDERGGGRRGGGVAAAIPTVVEGLSGPVSTSDVPGEQATVGTSS
jgi:hypothetical protein